MGTRGPPPTPKSILAARGSWRAEHTAELAMPEGIPDVPEWLEGRALEYWQHLVPMLGSISLLRQTDGAAFARYCQLYARWQQCDEFIKIHGYSYTTEAGIKTYPEAQIFLRLSEALNKLEDRFGLTPSARVRVAGSVGEKKDKNNKSKFFGGN